LEGDDTIRQRFARLLAKPLEFENGTPTPT
jgi:hypothetical protein